MNRDELAKVLRLHRMWLRSEPGGTRADLTRADLTDAYLRGANLTRADLSDALWRVIDLADQVLADTKFKKDGESAAPAPRG